MAALVASGGFGASAELLLRYIPKAVDIPSTTSKLRPGFARRWFDHSEPLRRRWRGGRRIRQGFGRLSPRQRLTGLSRPWYESGGARGCASRNKKEKWRAKLLCRVIRRCEIQTHHEAPRAAKRCKNELPFRRQSDFRPRAATALGSLLVPKKASCRTLPS